MLKENKGVTLVALVITIIVLLILAGVTLSMVMGDSGIFGKATDASVKTNVSSAKDAVRLATLEVTTAQYNNDGAFTAISDNTQSGIESLVNDQMDEYTIDTKKIYKKNANGTKGEAVKNASGNQLEVEFTYGSNNSITPTFSND